MNEFKDVLAVVLAGGSGTRLWPLSRLQAPKQFVSLMGEATMLEATITRLAPLIEAGRVLVVTNEETAAGEGYRALEPYERILEPAPRNTAPAIGVAAVRCRIQGTDPVLVILPSDHVIQDVPAFQAALRSAIRAAADGKLLTFGIVPRSAETGFGYIEADAGGIPRRVKSFHEKPDRLTAERFVADGKHFWNSGMFVWRASAILREIELSLPEVARALKKIEDLARAGGKLDEAIKRHFEECPAISIDQGVLEKSANLFMVPGDFGWSDVGSWDAVYEVAEKDQNHNALLGNVLAVDCRNTLIRSHNRLVAAVEVEDISIVETPDAVLVARRGSSQNVRKVVEELARRSASEHLLHTTVQRPWGSYTVLEQGLGFKIKRIEVRPGGRLSLQSHEHRSEHWIVVSGVATVSIDGTHSELSRNQSTFVPLGSKHRLENRGPSTLSLIEVQAGDYVEEDDIRRYDDVYGRVKA